MRQYRYYLKVSDFPNNSWIQAIREMYPECTWNSGAKLEDCQTTQSCLYVWVRSGDVVLLNGGQEVNGVLYGGATQFPCGYKKLMELFA